MSLLINSTQVPGNIGPISIWTVWGSSGKRRSCFCWIGRHNAVSTPDSTTSFEVFALRLDTRQEQLPKIPATAEATAAEAATAAERSLPELTLAPLLELTGLVSVVLGPLNPVDLLCTTSRVFSRPPLTSSCCCLRRLTGVTAWSLQSLLELRFLWLWETNT